LTIYGNNAELVIVASSHVIDDKVDENARYDSDPPKAQFHGENSGKNFGKIPPDRK
jgi:hypothetical protein